MIKDIVLACMLIACVLWALKEPWIGILGWTLVSLMSPHENWGTATATWPMGTALAIGTLLGFVVTKDKSNPMVGAGPWCVLLFTVWITITLPSSIYFDPSYPLWLRSIKIFFMLFITLSLINTRKKLNLFIWVNVIALAFYGVKGGVFTIMTGGNHRVWGPGGFIEGNNEVALAVICVIPLMRYLQTQMSNVRAKTAMTSAMALCVIMALGSYSRGALLGVAAMGAFFWLKGDRKLLWGVLIIAMGAVALSLMPEQWWARMNTIESYQGDESAQGRINAWWMAFNLAKDRIFGGGFMIWTGSVFQIYAPVPDDPHAAHSIYFQVLGEHGFIGLFIFLSIGVATWMAARWLIKVGRASPQFAFAAELGPMVQVSMIGYAVTGAFLSLAYYDLPYNVMVMAVVAQRIVRQEQAAAASERYGMAKAGSGQTYQQQVSPGSPP